MSTSEMTFKTELISFKFPEHNLECIHMYFSMIETFIQFTSIILRKNAIENVNARSVFPRFSHGPWK